VSAALDRGIDSTDLATGELDVDPESLVLDPALQCRVEVNQVAVEEYAEAWVAGAEFPPVRVIRVDGRLLVVDGWHRTLAFRHARKCGYKDRTAIPCQVTNGTRRDAMLAAAQANADNGLRRTNEDKRRAVRLLLQDPEWCGLSSRELAPLAGVSHNYINQVRREYSVKPGEPVTQAMIERVDGEPSPEWKALIAKVGEERWKLDKVEKIRTAPDVLTVLETRPHYYDEHKEAEALRLQELVVDEAWPWPEDKSAKAIEARCSSADTVKDLVKILHSKKCPADRREELCSITLRASTVEKGKRDYSYGSDEIKRFEGRPALEQAVREHNAKIDAREAKRRESNPYDQAKAVQELKDPEAQAAALRALDARALQNIWASRLLPEVRDGVYREFVGGGELGSCPNPACGSWLDRHGQCVLCRSTVTMFRERSYQTLATSAQLIAHPGFGMLVRDRVCIDRAVVEVVDHLVEACADQKGWAKLLKACDPGLRQALEAWAGSEDPELLGDPARDYQAADEQDEDDVDPDADLEDDLPDDDDDDEE
jgi:hypothetical protein